MVPTVIHIRSSYALGSVLHRVLWVYVGRWIHYNLYGQPYHSTILSTADVTVDSHENPQILSIHLPHNKTDQFSKGTHIYLGRIHTILCPVSAILGVPGNTPINTGTFVRWQPSHQIVHNLREPISQLGMITAGHSFRIAAASTTAAVGISDSVVQLLGRWKSSPFLAYIRSSDAQLAGVSTLMATSSSSENRHYT